MLRLRAFRVHSTLDRLKAKSAAGGKNTAFMKKYKTNYLFGELADFSMFGVQMCTSLSKVSHLYLRNLFLPTNDTRGTRIHRQVYEAL